MPVPTEKITKERLDFWAADLAAEHATPMFLIGVGHDHTKGVLVICAPPEKDFNLSQLRGFLRAALRKIESELAEEN